MRIIEGAVATNLKDVTDQFRYELDPLDEVLGAYLTIRLDPVKLHVWTLLAQRQDSAETAIAEAESRLVSSFPTVAFDFTTVHLRGRDPAQFIPEGAIPIKVSDPEVFRAFRDALTVPGHARA